MRRNILKNIIALAALFIPYIASAQCYEIYKDGVRIVYNYNEVDSIVYDANEHEQEPIEGKYVDLGLPSGLKWAKCNIGAKLETDEGDYYAWGELETKSTYDPNNCTTTELDIEDISGNPKYDTATHVLGSNWRMPTDEELQELAQNCKWEWVDIDGRAGAKVTGPNGNSIFLPAAGYRCGSDIFEDHYKAYYWSSTSYDIGISCCLEYKESNTMPEGSKMYRDMGMVIRPVLVE